MASGGNPKAATENFDSGSGTATTGVSGQALPCIRLQLHASMSALSCCVVLLLAKRLRFTGGGATAYNDQGVATGRAAQGAPGVCQCLPGTFCFC